jgi:hypothetical protein
LPEEIARTGKDKAREIIKIKQLKKPMTITRQILQEKRETILEIARRHGAHDVRLFGSVARGDNTETSDVDILVRFDPDRSLFDHGGLLVDLEEYLGIKVDVVSEGALSGRFRAEVERDVTPL